VTPGSGLPFDEPAAAPPGAPARRVVSVSELTAALRDLVETRFAEVWVEGELSGAKVWNTGHLYFTLKDAHAQVKGVMFRSSLRLLRFKPVDGVHVVARGRLSVYDPRGEYQLVCEHMEPRGLGALQLAYEQLRARLAAEGLFDQARKRPLPALPRRIGVVTSLEGAALRDIIRVLRRRYPNAHVIVAPARVQGEGAARDIARAIRQVTRIDAVDVVIAGRGGGSIEDLWAFNEEPVARAIAASPVPVISAVGHETDVTIADFVADLRAPTPSAAAELVVRRKDEFTGHIDALARRAASALRARLQRLAGRLHQLQARPAYAGLPARIAFRHRHVAELAAALRRGASLATADRRRRLEALTRALALHHPQQRLGRGRSALVVQDRRLAGAVARHRHAADTRLREAAAHLHALSPLAVLGRGYAMCWTADRSTLVRTADAVTPGERVHVRLASGELGCEVREVRPDRPPDA
jgi:exodeoxyribonuclease VII large subunit